MLTVTIDPKLMKTGTEKEENLKTAINEAYISMARQEAFKEGYNAAMEHMEKILHDFRCGVRY